MIAGSHASGRTRARSIAIFGGSFDPIHVGHLAVARAAQRRFQLDEVNFVVAGQHPFHQKRGRMAPFPHRYAMVALACADHAHFVPSLAEAGENFSGGRTFYSYETVRRFRQAHSGDRLYFITGADSFLEIPLWKSYESLLDSCDFIVASRPGYRLDPLRLLVPPEMLRPAARRGETAPGARLRHAIELRRTTIHLLDTLRSSVSSSDIRQRRRRGAAIHGLVPPRVEDYILQQGLYL